MNSAHHFLWSHTCNHQLPPPTLHLKDLPTMTVINPFSHHALPEATRKAFSPLRPDACAEDDRESLFLCTEETERAGIQPQIILYPRSAPHRLGRRPKKSCLKKPRAPAKHAGVRFLAAEARCIMTDQWYQPHTRSTFAWQCELYHDRMRRKELKPEPAWERSPGAEEESGNFASVLAEARLDKRLEVARCNRLRLMDEGLANKELRRMLGVVKRNGW